MSHDPRANIAWRLTEQALKHPHLPAVTCALKPARYGESAYVSRTFEQLNQESARVARGLKRLGLKVGDRAVVMVKPGPELFAITFGLFKAGVAPVLIDPGMDKRDLKACLRSAEPTAFIGIAVAHLARHLLGWNRGQLSFTIGVGRGAGLLSQTSFEALCALGEGTPDELTHYIDPEATDPEALAAVLFTSGSTGAPKGAMYRHKHFSAQVELLKQMYTFRAGAVDVPTFPLFALFDPALGMSAVFPYMDFSAPGKADPQEVFAVIERFGAEHMFCSPALLKKLAEALPEPLPEPNDHKGEPGALSTLKRVISAGAPVPLKAMSRLRAHMHPEGELFTPYGATESLPISSISSAEVAEVGDQGQREGRGVCVGRVTPGVAVALIEVTDEPLPTWDQARVIEGVGPTAMGEVVVYGPSTTQGYLARPDGDRASKIAGPPPGVEPLAGQEVSHRMGDMGYFDEEGRLWLCGRKSHRVPCEPTEYHAQGFLSPLCVEGVMNTIVGVKRTALVSTSKGPVLCVELEGGARWSEVEDQLKHLAPLNPLTAPITRFLRHEGFPVDTRHNAKIKREVLSVWAEGLMV